MIDSQSLQIDGSTLLFGGLWAPTFLLKFPVSKMYAEVFLLAAKDGIDCTI